MTCGVYSLNFLNTNKVYIGQSICIEKRYIQHLNNLKNGNSNHKLLAAYAEYKKPLYTILIECDISELDELETESIAIWNSVDNGFNVYYTSNDTPTYNGFGFGNSKYSKQQIIDVFNLLLDIDQTSVNIAEITEVGYATVSKIASLQSHLWLKQDFPEKYSRLESVSLYRNTTLRYSNISNKLSAKSKGIIYPKIKDPQGNIFNIDNAYKFAKENKLAPNHFQEVLNGHRKSHKGWKLCQEELV